jgi:hypothetical protein
MVRRFDRDEAGHRRHLHSYAGLTHTPLRDGLDYGGLMDLARNLTKSQASVGELYRRAVFNVLAANDDDHGRNHAFLMDESGEWRLSPAFDIPSWADDRALRQDFCASRSEPAFTELVSRHLPCWCSCRQVLLGFRVVVRRGRPIRLIPFGGGGVIRSPPSRAAALKEQSNLWSVLSRCRVYQPTNPSDMKNKNNRSAIQAIIIIFLLAAIGVSWYFTRLQACSRRALEELAAGSPSLTRTSERSAPDPAQDRRRQESISLAAQKWYEEVLVKYPQMKPEYRDVPDEQNGSLQFLLLEESLKEPKLPEDLNAMRMGDSPWTPEKLKAWLAENKEYFDQILHLAELPDRSIKGLDFNRLAAGRGRFSSEFGYLLSSSARLAFEDGDRESALRYSKAAINLSNHFTDIEVPSLLGKVMAEGIRASVRDSFLEGILPGLAGDPQALSAWREALFRNEGPATEAARVLSGEWNVMMRVNILPTLLGSNFSFLGTESFQIPDADAFFDCYTEATEHLAASLLSSGPDRYDLSHGELEFPDSGFDPQTLRMLRDLGSAYRNIFPALGITATNTAMISAAVAVQLGEEPGIDPVSGKPFQWDPKSRTLFPPEGVEGHDPIKVR